MFRTIIEKSKRNSNIIQLVAGRRSSEQEFNLEIRYTWYNISLIFYRFGEAIKELQQYF